MKFERGVSDSDVRAVGKAQQLADPKATNHNVNRPLQLCYRDLLRPFTSAAIGGYKYVSKQAHVSIA